MTPYPFDNIHINGRDVLIQQILTNREIAKSEFEARTFSFIRDWLLGTEKFTQLTSGSTGEPKEITLTREQMIISARMTQEALKLQAGWHCLLCLDPSFIAGKMMIVRCFATGMKIYATEPVANPLITTSHQSIQFIALVPYQLHEIVRSEKANALNAMNSAIIGGATVDSETREKLMEFTCQFYATYGMTETLSHVALMPLNGKHASDHFTVLPGITISMDERSCLVIHADHLPARKIITNDLVEIADSYTFKWIGRWDNVINTGGLKVSPEKLEVEIEKIIQELGLTTNFLVCSVPDLKLGNRIVLLLEQKVTQKVLERLWVEIKKRISKHEVPKEILSATSFVLTHNGKINRVATQKLAAEALRSTK